MAHTIRTSSEVRADAPRLHPTNGCYNRDWYTDLPAEKEPFDGSHATFAGNGGLGMYVWPQKRTAGEVLAGSHGWAQPLYANRPARLGPRDGEPDGDRECFDPLMRLTRVMNIRGREYVMPNTGYQAAYMLPRHMLAPLVEDPSWYNPCR